jgi:hypothetical protein
VKYADYVSARQFIQRRKALALWRTIVRGSRKISDAGTRKETLGFAREEFKRNKGVEDLVCLIYNSEIPHGVQANKLIADTDTLPDINGQDTVGEYGEVYRRTIIQVLPILSHIRLRSPMTRSVAASTSLLSSLLSLVCPQNTKRLPMHM